MTIQRRVPKTRVATIVIASLGAAGSLLLLSGAGQSPPADQSATVQRVARDALIAEQTSFMPASLSNLDLPEAKQLTSGQSELLGKVPSVIANGPTAKDIATASIRGRDEINKLFTKSAAVKQLQQQGDVIDSLNAHDDPNTRPLGGGVSKVVWDQITLTSDTAILRGTTVFWAELAQRDNQTGKWSVARPSNECTIDMTLIQVSPGVWKVSEYTWHFTAAGEP